MCVCVCVHTLTMAEDQVTSSGVWVLRRLPRGTSCFDLWPLGVTSVRVCVVCVCYLSPVCAGLQWQCSGW